MARGIEWGIEQGLPENPIPGNTYAARNQSYWVDGHGWKWVEYVWTRSSSDAPYQWVRKDWASVTTSAPIIQEFKNLKNDPLPPIIITAGLIIAIMTLIVLKK